MCYQRSGAVQLERIFDGQPHGFFNHGRSDNKYYNATVVAMDKFLASLGWIDGAPTLASQ